MSRLLLSLYRCHLEIPLFFTSSISFLTSFVHMYSVFYMWRPRRFLVAVNWHFHPSLQKFLMLYPLYSLILWNKSPPPVLNLCHAFLFARLGKLCNFFLTLDLLKTLQTLIFFHVIWPFSLFVEVFGFCFCLQTFG